MKDIRRVFYHIQYVLHALVVDLLNFYDNAREHGSFELDGLVITQLLLIVELHEIDFLPGT